MGTVGRHNARGAHLAVDVARVRGQQQRGRVRGQVQRAPLLRALAPSVRGLDGGAGARCVCLIVREEIFLCARPPPPRPRRAAPPHLDEPAALQLLLTGQLWAGLLCLACCCAGVVPRCVVEGEALGATRAALSLLLLRQPRHPLLPPLPQRAGPVLRLMLLRWPSERLRGWSEGPRARRLERLHALHGKWQLRRLLHWLGSDQWALQQRGGRAGAHTPGAGRTSCPLGQQGLCCQQHWAVS